MIQYALDHPKDGFRRLCWQMMDEDAVYVSPSSVYRILLDEDLLYRWKPSWSRGERPLCGALGAAEHDAGGSTWSTFGSGPIIRSRMGGWSDFIARRARRLGDEELHNLGRAREIIGRWVKHYNENRLHASLDYQPS